MALLGSGSGDGGSKWTENENKTNDVAKVDNADKL